MINNNYQSIKQHDNKRNQQQQSFGNALAPVVGVASFIENNGFLGEFLTIDTMGMGVPRTAQGYSRNKEELGHLNYKAGREEMVRELLSGPAFFFIPATVLAVSSMLKGKATKVTTDTLDTFKKVMTKTAEKVTNNKDAKEIKEKFVNDLFDTAFEKYENKQDHVDKIKKVFIDYINNDKKSGFLGFGDKIKAAAQKEATETLTTLNKANGKFIDNTGSLEVHGQELEISQLVSDIPHYLENFTKSAGESAEPMGKFTEDFHSKTKTVRQWTNITAGAAVASFLLVIPKLYQTGKEFPGVDGLDTTNVKGKKTAAPAAPKGKQTVNFSGAKFDKFAKFCDIDKDNSFTRNMFFSLSGIFMLGARFKDARGNDEKREVLTRDIPAVAIAVYGARLLNNNVAKLATSISGIPIIREIKDKDKTSYNFVSGKQVESWYTNLEKLQNPLVTFSETINRNKGKLTKVMEKLSLTEDLKGIVGKENASNDEIIASLKKAQEAKDAKFVALEKKLIANASKDNKLFKSAINLQSGVKLGNLGIIAGLLGFCLPRLNIVMTKKKYQQQPQKTNLDLKK